MPNTDPPGGELDLLARALELPPEAREAFLFEAAADDLVLLERLQHALAIAAELAGSAVERGAAGEHLATGGSSEFGWDTDGRAVAFEPPPRVGRYEILNLLGSGASGVVYLARHVFLEHQVALKFYPTSRPDRSLPAMERAQREGQILARLQHPNITRVYDLDMTGDPVPYLVEEYVAGHTLAARLREMNLDRRTSLRYTLQIADALDAAHAQGITHRDLKPMNVMLTAGGDVKVVDFSIATLLGSKALGIRGTPSATGLTAELAGTLPYVSPEQWSGGAVTEKTDIWALGCVLYECLTGKISFPDGPPPEDRWVLPMLTDLGDSRVAKLLQACWQQDPVRRPSARDVRDRIVDLLTPRGRGVVATMAGLAMTPVIVYLALRLMSPVSAGWENDALVLHSSISIYAPKYTGGYPPPEQMRISRAESELAFVLPRRWGLCRQTVALVGAFSKDCSRLVLLDWRGKEVQEFRAASVLPDAGLPSEMQWTPLDVESRPGEAPLVFVPSRAIRTGATWLHLFAYADGRLQLRASLAHRGHLEDFPRLDLNGDGVAEQFALGWTSDAESAGGERSETGRSVLYALDLSTLALRASAGGTRIEQALDSPTMLENGVVSALSFPVDRFAPGRTSRCTGVRWCATAETLLVDCFGADVDRAVEYALLVQVRQVVACVDAQYTNSYREAILARHLTPEAIDGERLRLRTSVKRLTPNGWTFLPSVSK